MSTKVKLSNVRLFFPDLFKAVEFTKGDGKPRYNATFGVASDDAKQMKLVADAIVAECAAAWPKDHKAKLTSMANNPNKMCFLDGATKSYEGAEGVWLLSSHRKEKDGPPGRFTRSKQIIDADKGELYSGCYVNAVVEIWAQAKGEGSPGIRCGLVSVQFNANGDAFTGASKPDSDDFDAIDEGTNAEDLV